MDTFEFAPPEGFAMEKPEEGMVVKALEDATFEPAAFIEAVAEYPAAEELQVSLEVITASLVTEITPADELSSLPMPIPSPADEVSALPVPLPSPADEVSDLPGPLPSPADEVSTLPVPVPSPAVEVSSLPGPLPSPAEEVSTLPGPMPSPADEVSTLPIPMPSPVEGMSEMAASVEAGTVEIPKSDPLGNEALIKEPPVISDVPLAGDRGAEFAGGTRGLDVILPVSTEPLTGVGAEVGTLPGFMPGAADDVRFDSLWDKQTPEIAVSLAGIGTQGGVDGTKSAPFSPDMPTNVPTKDSLDMFPSGEGAGGAPKVIGNIPGHKGSSSGDTGIPTFGSLGSQKANEFLAENMAVPMGSGSHSSSGGPPVENPGNMYGKEEGGGGAVDGGQIDLYFYEDDQETTEDCHAAANRARELTAFAEATSGKTSGFVLECFGVLDNTKTTYTGDTKSFIGRTKEVHVISTPMIIEGKKPKQGLDDMSPTPYTGSGHWDTGQKIKENDTGQVLPDADLDGLDGRVWRSDPDTVDDSGQFYGGIMGGPVDTHPDSGGARPIDPIGKTDEEAEADQSGGN